jgi:hypothetical protein
MKHEGKRKEGEKPAPFAALGRDGEAVSTNKTS